MKLITDQIPEIQLIATGLSAFELANKVVIGYDFPRRPEAMGHLKGMIIHRNRITTGL